MYSLIYASTLQNIFVLILILVPDFIQFGCILFNSYYIHRCLASEGIVTRCYAVCVSAALVSAAKVMRCSCSQCCLVQERRRPLLPSSKLSYSSCSQNHFSSSSSSSSRPSITFVLVDENSTAVDR